MDLNTQDPRRRIAVTRLLPEPLMDRLRSSYISWVNPEDRTLSSDELRRAAAALAADVLLVMAMDRLDAAAIGNLPPAVRIIATLSVGHDQIDLDAARGRGIAVLHTPDVHSGAVAEMAMLLLLGAARRAHEGSALLYGGHWGGWSPTQLLGAIVVNIARGDLVDDEALVAALRPGRVAAAGLDVFNNEPGIHEGYKTLPNVFLQPHQGSSTMGARVRMGELLLDSIERLLAGAAVPNRIA